MTTPQKHNLRPLPHEWLRNLIPDELIRVMVEDARQSKMVLDNGTAPAERLPELASFNAFLTEIERGGREDGDQEGGRRLAYALGSHVHYALNFDLHRRKVFWIDDALAWMLQHTTLDIEGRALQLPFPCFALAFQDEATLDIMRAHFAEAAPKASARSQPPCALTVYVTRGSCRASGMDLHVTFVADTGAGGIPYLITRSLHIKPDDDLETILASDMFGIDPSRVGPEFRTPELRRLVHLVINAVLYATSTPTPWAVVPSPAKAVLAKARDLGAKRQKRAATRAAELRRLHSGESVFFLPGRIPISQLRELRELEHGHGGRELFRRFMVRGHWRRPPQTWSDQRIRWIEPHWKGPAMASVVEREYRMTL